MKSIKISLFLFSILLLTACEKALMDANPKTDALAIFDEYSTLVKEKYAMLEFKDVDINQLSDSLRATISEGTNDTELFNTLGIITSRLRDGHSNLIQDKNDSLTLFAGFDLLAGYPAGIDLDLLIANYIAKDVNPSIQLLEGGDIGLRAVWGTLVQDNEIGYIWIPSWDVDITDEEIEQIFTDLADTKGLIFDMRINGGGDPSLATKFASYFTDKAIDTGFERFKTGPAPNDFSDSRVILQPTDSRNKYLKEVRVLTDRNVYSASTTFLYSVDPIDRIKTVGQRTGGGSGSVADGYLANGWYWSLSTSEFIDAKGQHLDDGVDPDIPVALDLNDTAKDEVLEAAIAELQ